MRNVLGQVLPVDVAELVLTQATLQADGNIERPTGRHSSSNTRHGNHRNVLQLDISGRLRDKDKALVQEVKETFVGLDGALNSVVTVVAQKVLGWHNNLLTGQSTEDLGHHLMDRLLVV